MVDASDDIAKIWLTCRMQRNFNMDKLRAITGFADATIASSLQIFVQNGWVCQNGDDFKLLPSHPANYTTNQTSSHKKPKPWQIIWQFILYADQPIKSADIYAFGKKNNIKFKTIDSVMCALRKISAITKINGTKSYKINKTMQINKLHGKQNGGKNA